MIPTIEWDVETRTVKLIDQTKLPGHLEYIIASTHAEIGRIIKNMNIRGAPAIGVAAAFGMVLAAQENQNQNFENFIKSMHQAANLLKNTRPTAINLFWAIERMLKIIPTEKSDIDQITERLLEEALKMWQEDINCNKAIGKHGASLLSDNDVVLTHCNAGSLATVLYGTALAPIRWAVEEEKKKIQVIADETRPRLQGARLTAWELNYDQIPVKIEPDNTAGLLMRKGLIQKIIVGADRIVSDAVFNKIGTYMLAIVAKYHNIPFYVAAPGSTLALDQKESDVIIEQRDGQFEVAKIMGIASKPIVPDGVECINYAFDATPMDLVTAIITEDGLFSPKELLTHYL
ncbi:S-methyl-5-thioribose-1-phosphate isomerase [Candidatus Harpocratesius sp.]